MLQLQKVLQVKTHLRTVLESSRLRLVKEFGAENKALEHVSDIEVTHCGRNSCSVFSCYKICPHRELTTAYTILCASREPVCRMKCEQLLSRSVLVFGVIVLHFPGSHVCFARDT
jgi:hypothetical protein